MSGKTPNDPKKYITGLTKEEKSKLFPEGTYVLTKNNKVNIMRNNRPYFTNTTNVSLNHSPCFGKRTLKECPEKDCVWYNKTKQCRLKKYATKSAMSEDSRLRTNNTNTKIYKSKVLNLLQSLIDNYKEESDYDYLKISIKQLNTMLNKFENNKFNKFILSTEDFSSK
jgi:hypothetical protein